MIKPRCNPEPANIPEAVTICNPFKICLPFGRALHFDGKCLQVSGEGTIPDGEYTSITVVDGCIVSAGYAELPIYTPPPCTPEAEPCFGEGSGIILQPDPANLTSLDAGGRLGTYLVIDPTSNVQVTGYGTTQSPMKLTVSASGMSTALVSGTPDILPLEGSGVVSSPWVVSHAISAAGEGTIGGVKVDAYGHVVGAGAGGEVAVTQIIAGDGVIVDLQGGVATIALSLLTSRDIHSGGYHLIFDQTGRLTTAEQEVNVQPQQFDPYFNMITVNETGQITAVTPGIRTMDGKWGAWFSGTRDETKLTFASSHKGQLRVSYTGSLEGTSTSTALQSLSGYRVLIDGIQQQAYMRIIGNVITEVHVLSQAAYEPGDHVVEIQKTTIPEGTYAFNDTGFLDVSLVEVRA